MADITPAGSRTAEELIASTTSAVNSREIVVAQNETVTIFCDAAPDADSNLQMKKPDGTWATVKDGNWPLNSLNYAQCIFAKGIYRVAKSATTGAHGVHMYGPSFLKRGQ